MLTVDEIDLLDNILEAFPYSCGSPITPPESHLHDKVAIILNITCSMHQHPLNYEEMFPPTCSRCGDVSTNDDPLFYNEQLKQEGRWGTVLPICVHCKASGIPNPTIKAKKKGTAGTKKRVAAGAAAAGSGRVKKKIRNLGPAHKVRNPSLTERAQAAAPRTRTIPSSVRRPQEQKEKEADNSDGNRDEGGGGERAGAQKQAASKQTQKVAHNSNNSSDEEESEEQAEAQKQAASKRKQKAASKRKQKTASKQKQKAASKRKQKAASNSDSSSDEEESDGQAEAQKQAASKRKQKAARNSEEESDEEESDEEESEEQAEAQKQAAKKQKAARNIDSSSDEEDAMPCVVVGVRRDESGKFEQFIYWETYRKDECTFEASANTIEDRTVINKVLVVDYNDGSSKEARVLSHEVSHYELQWEGTCARNIPRGPQRKFQLDLSSWADAEIIGWKCKGYELEDPLE